ncbi:MAG: hypothetical protein DMG62_03280 [Acidobacteria bacterium]|nr:MAG: hypothetical protein DMG62_03280 [Acidobacteriota bacterium]
MIRARFASLLILLCSFVLLLPGQSFGQAVYGSIFGTVTDPTGAVIPNAKVTVTDVRKGTSDSITTNESGNYSATHLIPDVYQIKVEAQGFETAKSGNMNVSADTGAKFDVVLKAGAQTETVQVTAEAPQLKTDRADVAIVFDTKQVEDLPIFNRNFTQFELLTPGTQKLGWSHAATENPQGSQQIEVNGQHFSGTAFGLDGTDNQDPILGIIVINPTLESVTETKIASQNYDAEFGKAVAGVVTAQTKSGSNDFHGSAFGFRRSDANQARDPFTQFQPDKVTGRMIPVSRWGQFGGSIGGPIIKDKLFFFGDYQGTRRTTGRSIQTSVPTALLRNSCASGSGCNFADYAPVSGNIFDPLTGAQFPNNIIPNSRLSPAALKILAALPAPNAGAATNITNNFVGSGSGSYDDDAFNIRIDDQLKQNVHLFGRYSYAKFKLSGNPVFGAIGGNGFGEGGLAGSANTRNQSIASGFDYVLSPTLLTDFRFGYVKYNPETQKPGSDPNAAATLGLLGLNNSGDSFTNGLPAFFFKKGGDTEYFGYNTGDGGIGAGLGVARCNCPLTENEQQFQFVNNWTKLLGNHSIKIGGDIRYAENLRVPSDANRTGQLTFNARRTSNAGVGGSSFATFLIGDVTNFGRYVRNPSLTTNPGERQKRTFFYGEDTWRFSEKLTISYGLRWEIYFPETVNLKGGGGFATLEDGAYRVADFGKYGSNGNIGNSFNNFAPRLGVAYQITPKTVVRAGYGRSFDIGVFGSLFGHTVTQNLPVLVNQSVTSANGDAGVVYSLGTNASPAQTAPAYPFPAIPSSGLIPFDNQTSPKIRPDHMRLPTLDAWNVTVQRQLTGNTSAELAYVANKGTHVFAGNGPSYNANTATIVGFPTVPFNQRRKFHNAYTGRDPVTGAAVPCCDVDFSYLGNNASNNYQALQAKVEKRFSQGLEVLGHYTWSRAQNYNDGYYAIDPKVEYGRQDFNRNHLFLVNALYELPFGHGKTFAGGVSKGMNYLVGGWQLNTITSWGSGLPWTPGYNNCGAERDNGPCRPDQVGSFSMGAGDLNPVTHQVNFFTPVAPLNTPGATSGAFRRPTLGQFGNIGRNTFYGPRTFTSDFSVLKNVPVTERVNAQFRMEAFNVFNHPVLNTPGNKTIDSTGSDAGKITSLEPFTQMRQLQFGLRISF